jgi:outer membrane protein assembly factor BamB
MRHVVASALVLAILPLATGLSGCSQTGGQAWTPVPSQPLPDLSQAGLQQTWQRSVPMAANEHIRNTWRVGNSLYITTSNTRIVRLDARTGVLAFDKALGAEHAEIFRPIDLKPAKAGGFGTVLVTTRRGGVIFDQETGDIVREGTFGGISPSCSPVLAGNVLCVGGAGKFYAFYLDRLNIQRWVKDAPGDLFNSTPVVVSSDIIIASKNGELARLDSDDGEWRWKDRRTNGQVVAGLAADGRAVYIPALDQRLYAFSVDRGAELWQAQLQGRLDQTPSLGGNVVLCPASGQGLFALDRQNGDRRWFAQGVTSVATVSGDHVWVGDAQGNVKSLSLASGDVLAQAEVPNAAAFIRNEEDDTVYIVNRSGAVGAYRARR